MQDELDILVLIAENPAISQRKIMEQTGISLGQVNFLIKKCVRKGLIKIEGQTSKSIRYNITPRGFAEKAKLTMDYIKISYNAIISLTEKIKRLSEKYESEGVKIFVFGMEDEMMGICRLALGDKATYGSNISVIAQLPSDYVIFYWGSNDLNLEENDNYRAENILL